MNRFCLEILLPIVHIQHILDCFLEVLLEVLEILLESMLFDPEIHHFIIITLVASSSVLGLVQLLLQIFVLLHGSLELLL